MALSFSNIFSTKQLQEFSIVDWGYTEEDRPISWKNYNEWVENGHHGPLGYMADHRQDKRETIKKYFPEFSSALTFMFSYHPTKIELDNFYKSDLSNGKKIAGYVFGFGGNDYHNVIKEKLELMSKILVNKSASLKTAVSLDIHPVLERDLAFRSGLGFFGKNSMFISREHGSFYILGALFLSEKLKEKEKSYVADHCGSCTKCIDACPTNAIIPGKKAIISNLCISTYTIELFKDSSPPPNGIENSNGEIFGCDICQEVCPWNIRAAKNIAPSNNLNLKTNKKIADFFLRRDMKDITSELNTWSNRKYQKEFRGTALERTGRIGMLKNLEIKKY